jgi:argininosuccinate lyase
MSDDTLGYTQTTDIDARMLVHDIWGSIAHLMMLVSRAIVDEERGRAIAAELLTMLAQAEIGELVLDPALEDVHLNVEQRVIERLTLDAGGRLHTARSRNDQVVTDSRMYVRDALVSLADDVAKLVEVLLDRAAENEALVTLGYTHSQAAQPITFGFWLSSHASALLRDMGRLRRAAATANLSPLGACALAGTSFPIDRRMTATMLGFDDVLRHALDATSTRDYMVEAAAACATTMSQISRLAEEIVAWSAFEVRTVHIDDAFATGSSIMPQKKNPVVAELARAKAATVSAALTEILGVTKSVSMGYSCDLQQDKPPVWRALDVTSDTVRIFQGQVRTLRFDVERAMENCWLSFSTATELANLMTSGGMPFREAYGIVGRLVLHLESQKQTLRDANAALRWLADNGCVLLRQDYFEHVDPVRAAARQMSLGGTAPSEVHSTIEHLREAMRVEVRCLNAISARISEARCMTLDVAGAFARRELEGVGIVERVTSFRSRKENNANSTIAIARL